jgi:hypothetical protein
LQQQSLKIRFGLHAVFRIGGGKNRALASENVAVIAGFDAAAPLSNQSHVPEEATSMVAVSDIAPHNRLLYINISPLTCITVEKAPIFTPVRQPFENPGSPAPTLTAGVNWLRS